MTANAWAYSIAAAGAVALLATCWLVTKKSTRAAALSVLTFSIVAAAWEGRNVPERGDATMWFLASYLQWSAIFGAQAELIHWLSSRTKARSEQR